MSEPIDMKGSHLTVSMVVTIIYLLCMDGEVHVTGCDKNPGDIQHVLRCMNSKLSDADKAWIKAVIHEELMPKKPWVTT